MYICTLQTKTGIRVPVTRVEGIGEVGEGGRCRGLKEVEGIVNEQLLSLTANRQQLQQHEASCPAWVCLRCCKEQTHNFADSGMNFIA